MQFQLFFIVFAFFCVGISKVSAQEIFPLSTGLEYAPLHIYLDSSDSKLYFGGAFMQAGTIPTKGISSWDGTNWDSLGSGLNYNGVHSRSVNCIVKYQGEIWAGGSIDSIGNKQINWLARWDGTDWNPIPGGDPDQIVMDLKVYNGELYVAGQFENIGGITASKIAKWDGSTWSSFPVLDSTGGWQINKMIMYNNELYVGGNFDGQSDPKLKDIAKWNGNSWEPLGNGFSGSMTWINDFTIFDGNLIVAGYFQSANGDPGNNIVAWNGTNWVSLGSGCLPSNVNSVEIYQNDLYAGGQISTAGSVSVSKIAKWDGAQWSSIGHTFDNNIHSLRTWNNDLYIGGGFWTVDGDSLSKVVRYSPTVGISEIGINHFEFTIYPNPTNGNFIINHNLNSEFVIEIYNSIGQIIFNTNEIQGNNITFELPKNISKGIYFVKLSSENSVGFSQLIIN